MHTITDICGHTPLVKLQNICNSDQAEVCIKLERHNAGGSIKDRPAKYIIEQAEKKGLLQAGSTIIESSSGNFGLACAMIGAAKGYRVIIIVHPKTTPAQHALLKAYGAEVILVTEKDAEGSYIKAGLVKAQQLLNEIPHSFTLNQFFNLENSEAHYLQTAPELFAQCQGKIDAVVLNIGSGGHMGGFLRFFHEHSPQTKLIAADPVGSTIFGGTAENFLIPAIGLSWTPANIRHLQHLNAIYKVADEDAFLTTRILAKKEGILVGGSTGASVITALRISKQLGKNKRVVCIAADSGERYLDTIFNDEWMQERQLKTEISLSELNTRVDNLELFSEEPEKHANFKPQLLADIKKIKS